MRTNKFLTLAAAVSLSITAPAQLSNPTNTTTGTVDATNAPPPVPSLSFPACACGGATNYWDDITLQLMAFSDALGNISSNFYSSSGLLVATRDPLGATNANYWDEATGNLLATAVIQGFGCATVPMGTILSTNSFGYDANGNRIFSVTWRRVNGNWVGATNWIILDEQNRAIGSVDPLGYTNLAILDAAGQPIITACATAAQSIPPANWPSRARAKAPCLRPNHSAASRPSPRSCDRTSPTSIP